MSRQYYKLRRTENVKRNVRFGILWRIVSLFMPFLVRTVLIYRFGAEYLGLNSVFTSVLQVLNLAEMGFGTAIVYSLYKPIAEKDTDSICAYLQAFRKIYRFIGTVILGIGLLLMPVLPYLVRDTVIPGNLNLYLWYLIFLLDSVVSYILFGYKTCLPSAFQRNDLLNKVDMGTMIVKSIVQIMLLQFTRNFYLYLVAFPLFTILRNMLISYMVSKEYPTYTCRGKISELQKADLKKRVSGLMIFKLCITSRNGIDSVCISALLGLALTGMYNNYYYVLSTLVGVSMILCTGMIPGIGNSIVTETREKNYADMRQFNFMYMMIAGWASACMLCLCQPFMRIWAGEALMLPNSVVFLLCLYFYLLKMGDMRWVYAEAAGLWWECRYYMIVETVVNIVCKSQAVFSDDGKHFFPTTVSSFFQ